MKRGISFEIPNQYGQFLAEILKPVYINDFNWFITGEESYLVVEEELGEHLFPEEIKVYNGQELDEVLKNHEYYLLFVDLKAFPKNTKSIDIKTYEEFLSSDCQLCLLIVDCIYTEIYCKDLNLIEKLHVNALKNNYGNVSYITDTNDSRTRLSCW
ncbi:hypothetical protein CN692_03895 [Bacillus sp. AFS002410]|uniref:DUF2691 family protein n=1 Tax=Bacillus sp. AFS002410 TaxID=2033481 RepID=UPI000BF14FB0|nr:DUF2691 family protein [Bacillus sp. AFS002410]PEJ59931.1 hypothetical protein CN692_03895 [Bacillus sp. AFS002410]